MITHARNIMFGLLLIVVSCSSVRAQVPDSLSKFIFPLQLDTVVVHSGFDINAFIRRVRTDTTFYKAFKSLHLIPFTAVNSFTVYKDNGQVDATLNNRIKQTINNRGCRRSHTIAQQSTGGFIKRDSTYNYYTATLFYDLFFSREDICNQTDIVGGTEIPKGKGRMEKSKYELKQLMFNPGSKVSGVPFMGDRGSIFDEDQQHKYDFKVRLEDYNGAECYVFYITPKAGYEKQVVYNRLITWFRRSDFSILARDYSLSFNTMFYDFDVTMKVRTAEINNKLYPVHIDYDGVWHVITKKREKMKVVMDITY